MKNLANNHIAESILNAMDTVVNGAIRNLRYDQTLECIVVSNKKSKEGVYTVKSEDAQFEAYSNERYYVNDVVYVTVPQGDFNNQKFITGRKVDTVSLETTFNLKLPFDDFIGLRHLSYGFSLGERGFNANKRNEGSVLTDEELKDAEIVAAYEKTNLLWSWEKEENSAPTLETKLAIQVNVQSLLAHYHPLNGRYGLRLVVSGMTKNTETTSAQKIEQDIFFTNDDMYGNTYAYTTPYIQQKIFDISNLIAIDKIKIYFWQDHAFFDNQGNVIPSDVPANLIFSDLDVYLGMTADDINDERVILYTQDPIEYGANPSLNEEARAEVDTKTLEFAWVHRDYEKNEFVLVNSIEKLKQYGASIYWYHMEYGTEIDGTKAPERLGGVNWKYLEEEKDKFTIKVLPAIDKSKEKYKAIVHYPSNYTVSEPIVFNNIIDIESVNEALASNSKLIFKFLRPATAAEQAEFGENSEAYLYGNLIEDETIGHFFVYDENNICLSNSDMIQYSDIEYYIQIWINTEDENGVSQYIPLEAQSDDAVSWMPPYQLSMIEYFDALAEDDVIFGQLPDFANLRLITRKFRIRRFWDLKYQDNIISATCLHGGRTYYLNKEFLFGQSGSTGSEYTVRIILDSSSNYGIVKDTKFGIYAKVYDKDGLEVNDDTLTFSWKLLGPSIITKSGNEAWAANQESAWETSNKLGNINNYISGYVRNEYPPIFEVTVRNAADYPIVARRGFLLCNNANFLQTHNFFCPDRIEYKSDGSQPIYDNGEMYVETLGNKRLNGTWEMLGKHKELDENDKPFYASLDENEKHFTIKTTTYQQIGADGEFSKSYNTYRLTSKLNYDTITNRIAWYWIPEMATDYYYCLSYVDGDIWARQAIPIELNVYASSLVNSWNSDQLLIDEEHNAILSRMISAGAKDIDNRFTGVMMGDWGDFGDSSLDTPGLYGFIKGQQSFGFKTDGTGFIGLAGTGQIQFDGNQALISNVDKNFYINLNPMRYNGTNILSNERSYSPYFLYAKSKRTVETQNLNNIKFPLWTQPFKNDNENDYFVVDPNNGIYMSGGLYARYGAIGTTNPWIISDMGLTQTVGNQTIFLGDSSYNNGYCISVADSAGIVTGIKPNGFFFTKFGNIGGWMINDKAIYTGTEQGANGRVVLDSAGQLTFCNQKMIIDGVNGWIGIGRDSKPTAESHGVLIDAKGYISFQDGNTWIDGRNGNGYFGGRIILDSSNGTIYCNKNKLVTISNNEQLQAGLGTGQLFLSTMLLQGLGSSNQYSFSSNAVETVETAGQTLTYGEKSYVIGGDDTVTVSSYELNLDGFSYISATKTSKDIGVKQELIIGDSLKIGAENGTVILEPNQVGYLTGTWHINAAQFVGQNMYMIGTNNSIDGLVATQPWVESFVSKLNGMLNKQNGAINKVAESTANAIKKSMKNIIVIGKPYDIFNRLYIEWTTRDGNTHTQDSDTYAVYPNETHCQYLSQCFRMAGGYLYVDNTTGKVSVPDTTETAFPIFTTNPSFSISDSGVVSLSLTIAGNKLSSANFKLAETAFFKTWAISAGNNNIIFSTSSSTNTIYTAIKTRDGELHTDQSIKISVNENGSSSTVTTSVGLSISLSGVYNSGYTAGRSDGYGAGYDVGRTVGYNEGYKAGKADAEKDDSSSSSTTDGPNSENT